MASSSQTVGTSPEGNSPESHSGDWNNGEGYRCFFTASSCAKTTYINIPISQKLPILGPTRNNMGMDQYLLIPFLGGWTSIYQLFWCELQGYKVLTHCPMCVFFFWSVLCFEERRVLQILAVAVVSCGGQTCSNREPPGCGFQRHDPGRLSWKSWDKLRCRKQKLTVADQQNL